MMSNANEMQFFNDPSGGAMTSSPAAAEQEANTVCLMTNNPLPLPGGNGDVLINSATTALMDSSLNNGGLATSPSLMQSNTDPGIISADHLR